MNALWEFINGGIWVAVIVALWFIGSRALRHRSFRAQSQVYHGSTARTLGIICLVVAVIGTLLLAQRLVGSVLLMRLGLEDVYFLAGGALGGYLTYRHYVKHPSS